MDISDSKYSRAGASKANRVRAFWETESNSIVGKLLLSLLEHERVLFSIFDENHQRLRQECHSIAERLCAQAHKPEQQPTTGAAGLSAVADEPDITAVPHSTFSETILQPIEVFLSFAPADEPHARAFEAHLAALKRDGVLATWYEGLVNPGSDWDSATCQQLKRAQMILLLISADYLASDRCYDVHVASALERHMTGTARIIPIILRPCNWKTAKLSALPRNQKAVTVWQNQDNAFTEIVAEFRDMLLQIQKGAANCSPKKNFDSLP